MNSGTSKKEMWITIGTIAFIVWPFVAIFLMKRSSETAAWIMLAPWVIASLYVTFLLLIRTVKS